MRTSLIKWPRSGCSGAHVTPRLGSLVNFGVSNGDTPHHAPQWQRIVMNSEMLDRAIIPHQDISNLPFVAIYELVFDNGCSEFIYQGNRLFIGHAFDGLTFP